MGSGVSRKTRHLPAPHQSDSSRWPISRPLIHPSQKIRIALRAKHPIAPSTQNKPCRELSQHITAGFRPHNPHEKRRIVSRQQFFSAFSPSAAAAIAATAFNETSSFFNETSSNQPESLGGSIEIDRFRAKSIRCLGQLSGKSPRQLSGTAPRQVCGTAPRQLSGTAPRQLSGTAPRQWSGTVPRQWSGTVSREIWDFPLKRHSKCSDRESNLGRSKGSPVSVPPHHRCSRGKQRRCGENPLG